MPAEEAQFVAEDIADAGHHALVEQRLGDRAIRSRDQTVRGRARIPVRAEQVGSAVVDNVAVVIAFQDLQYAQVDADRADLTCFQDDPNPVVDPRGPRCDPPAAVHLQVRVNTGRPDADEQVLAPAAHLVDDLAAQVDRGITRHPNVAAGQSVTDQRLPQYFCGVENGVTFRHGLPQPQSTRGAGKPGVGQGRGYRRGQLRSQYRRTVDPLDQDRIDLAGGDQACDGDCRGVVNLRVVVGEAEHRPSAALEEPHQFTVDQHY